MKIREELILTNEAKPSEILAYFSIQERASMEMHRNIEMDSTDYGLGTYMAIGHFLFNYF